MKKTVIGILKTFLHNENGFTLVELLIVIAVLGIIATVAIPNVNNFIVRGHVAAANDELATVYTANGAYSAANGGSFATNSTQLTPYVNTALRGSYTFDGNDGQVLGASYFGASWNGTNFN
jgi:prepilin-type N-terminal cleavage/methylation domain-containing protein